MEELEQYMFQPLKFEGIFSSAKIVIDTNVLLAAYQYRNITFGELIQTLESLNNQKRLVIPSHVIKEFFKNRPERIVEIIQTVQRVRDGLPDVKKLERIEKKIPSMEYLSTYDQIQSSEESIESAIENYNTNLKEYREKLSALMNELKLFFNDDPILEKYSVFFKESYYKPDTLPEYKKMIEEFNSRAKTNTPPGYKDGKKLENGEGDYIIWKHILEIKDNDVIFITADNKKDWVYKDPNGNVISARRELVEEFYQLNKKSFCVVHPTTFLKAFNPEVDKEVIEDMNTKLDESNECIYQAISDLNEEADSVTANNTYSKLLRLLTYSDSNKYYSTGTNLTLDQAMHMVSHNKEFLNHLKEKANKIANSDLPTSEKQQKYNQLAQWAYISQPDI